VFGKDRTTAIQQVAADEECAAELDPAPTDGIDRILVPLPDVAEFTRLPTFIRLLAEDTTQRITLFHVVEGEESRERGQRIVEETRARNRSSRVRPRIGGHPHHGGGDEHDDEILRVADEYDAVGRDVRGGVAARRSGVRYPPDRIANETGDPVIVVNRDY